MPRVDFSPRTRPLADGTVVLYRLIEPADGPLLVELFETLSPESIYNRFLTPVREVTPEHVRRFVEIDQWREVAVAACLEEQGHLRIIGVGRYHRCEDPREAEVAVLVGDPWQGRGVGGTLLDFVRDLARSQGIRRFLSTVDPNNQKLLRFAVSKGYRTLRRYDDGLIRLESELVEPRD